MDRRIRFARHSIILCGAMMLQLATPAQASFVDNMMGDTEQAWAKQVDENPPSSRRRLCTDFVTPKEWMALSQSSKTQREKAERVLGLIKREISYNSSIRVEEIEKIIRYVDFVVADNKLPKRLSGYSFYIHPTPPMLSIPIQIYDDGRIYLHLLDRDPGRRKGGYKVFSRSVELTTETVVAHLATPVNGRRQLRAIISEITTMKEYAQIPQVLSVLDYDMVVTDVPNDKERRRTYQLVFQAPLYKRDLGELRANYGSVKNLLQISLSAADALNVFHEGGWIHRDVKPRNFFTRGTGKRLEVVIADFGLAQPATLSSLGRGLSGTRGFVAPEICLNRIRVGHSFETFTDGVAADVFSLGMTFYGLAKGRQSALRRSLHKVNQLALPPKGEHKGSPAEVKAAFQVYRSRHQAAFSRAAKAKIADENRVLHKYLDLVEEMTKSDSGDRPTLDQVAERLQQLLDTVS